MASLVAQMVEHLSAMWDIRVWSLGLEDPLEKEMATHSTILAWKIPWMEEPGRLQSMGLQSQTRLRDFTFNYLNMNFLKIEEVHRLIVSSVAGKKIRIWAMWKLWNREILSRFQFSENRVQVFHDGWPDGRLWKAGGGMCGALHPCGPSISPCLLPAKWSRGCHTSDAWLSSPLCPPSIWSGKCSDTWVTF